MPVSPEPPGKTAVGALASNASVPPAPPLPAVDENEATLRKAQEASRLKLDPAKQDVIAKREQELARKAQEIERKEQEVARKEQEAMEAASGPLGMVLETFRASHTSEIDRAVDRSALNGDLVERILMREAQNLGDSPAELVDLGRQRRRRQEPAELFPRDP